MSQNPFKELSLRFPGFTPVVEADPAGHTLVRLQEQTLMLPGEITRRGTLILGLPGSGKTTRLLERGVVSALSHREASVVVFAVQPGSARHAWAAFHHLREGSRVRPALFNPGDAAACTHFINPIAGVRSRSEAMAIGQTLGQPAHQAQSNSDSDYFLQQATTMIGHAILAVNTQHEGKGTLAMIREAIDGGPHELKSLGEAGASAELARFATEIIEGNRNSETTLAQMSNCLQWLFHEHARTATSSQELDFDRLLLKQPGLLVLAVNEEEIPRQRALISLIFRNLFAWIISRGRSHGGPLPRPLYIFIDELPAAGRIPEFGLRLTATFRKSNVSVVCAAQCEAQLMEVYGQETAAVLAGFGSRLYVPPIDFSDAERASARSGLIEVANHVTTPDGRLLTSTPIIRPLLLPGEIASPPRDQDLGPRILFRLADLPPFFGYLRATWQLPAEEAINTLAATLTLPRRRRRTLPPPPPDPPAPWLLPSTTAYKGWSQDRLRRRYRERLASIELASANPKATAWWRSFERTNEDRPHEVLWLAEQIAVRRGTIDVFFTSSVKAATDDVQAMLHYMDYTRRKNGAEARRRAAPAHSAPAHPDSLESEDEDELEDEFEDDLDDALEAALEADAADAAEVDGPDEEEFRKFLCDEEQEADGDDSPECDADEESPF